MSGPCRVEPNPGTPSCRSTSGSQCPSSQTRWWLTMPSRLRGRWVGRGSGRARQSASAPTASASQLTMLSPNGSAESSETRSVGSRIATADWPKPSATWPVPRPRSSVDRSARPSCRAQSGASKRRSTTGVRGPTRSPGTSRPSARGAPRRAPRHRLQGLDRFVQWLRRSGRLQGRRSTGSEGRSTAVAHRGRLEEHSIERVLRSDVVMLPFRIGHRVLRGNACDRT